MTAAYSKFSSPWKVSLGLSRQTAGALPLNEEHTRTLYLTILFPLCCTLYSTEVKNYDPEANVTSNQASKEVLPGFVC